MGRNKLFWLGCFFSPVILLFGTALLLFSLHSEHSLDRGALSLKPKNEDLKVILQRAGDYCLRLESASLDFICREDVEECVFHPYYVRGTYIPQAKEARPEINHSVYDYQLIRTGDIKESRILLKENGTSCHVENAPLNVKRFVFKYIIFGPIELIGHKSQPLYEYVSRGSKKLWGRRTEILEANPKSEKNGRHYVRLWVDRETGAVLKISREEESLGNYWALLEETKYIGRPSIRYESEYKFEKNGIRFPSRYRVVERYHLHYNIGIEARTGIERREKSRLTVTYDQCQFPTVETPVKF